MTLEEIEKWYTPRRKQKRGFLYWSQVIAVCVLVGLGVWAVVWG